MIKSRKIIIALVFSCMLLMGCARQQFKVTKADIYEVARDDANATKKECKNVSIKKGSNDYQVKFDTDTGSYSYRIGFDGIITSRDYSRKKTTTTNNTNETKTTNNTNEKEDTSKAESQWTDGQQQAINTALNYAGFTQTNVNNLTCSDIDTDNNTYTVTFTYNDVQNQVTIDANSYEVLASNVS